MWKDISALSGHPGDKIGSIWQLTVGKLTIIIEPYRSGHGGEFQSTPPWRVQWYIGESDRKLTAKNLEDAKNEALRIVREALSSLEGTT